MRKFDFLSLCILLSLINMRNNHRNVPTKLSISFCSPLATAFVREGNDNYFALNTDCILVNYPVAPSETSTSNY